MIVGVTFGKKVASHTERDGSTGVAVDDIGIGTRAGGAASTVSAGLSRADWVVGVKPEHVGVELGNN
jgi:hypothetical protein